MNIEEYYKETYPEGKPWAELNKAEQREIRRTRRKENWEQVKDTVVDIYDFIDLFLTMFGVRK